MSENIKVSLEDSIEECNHDYLFEGYPSDSILVSLSSYTIRAIYPRKYCKRCNTVCYASWAHYTAGDY